MKSDSGTYAVVFRNDKEARVRVGRRGYLIIQPGYYIYVGSAFGPGGVSARVARHFREEKTKHWHIDYIREFVTPLLAWCSYDDVHLEHVWAESMMSMKNVSVVKGFGCSDCKCESHLFYTKTMPELSRFASVVGENAEVWLYRNKRKVFPV